MRFEDPDFPASSTAITDVATRLGRALRRFLNLVAASDADPVRMAALIDDVDSLSNQLEGGSVPEHRSIWRKAPRTEPTALLPEFSYTVADGCLEGTVRFGRFHIGLSAAHGGAISLFFDEFLGALVVSEGRPSARTAYLRVDFRSLVPLDTDLHVKAWFAQEEGRKRLMRAAILHGDVTCAEAEGLWIVPRQADTHH